MQLLEREYDVEYKEPWDDINPDAVVLYWEAPCTVNGANAEHYNRIHNLPNRKVLLFAGGPIQKDWVENFDCLAVESRINEEECDLLGIPWHRAFGINTDLFKPMNVLKTHTTVTHGTSASWKRQWLVCQAMGSEALVFGQPQATDMRPFDECRECQATVLLEQPYDRAAELLNTAYVSVNCADFWGGGQRATLEAMACNLPVVVMEDSPKNREYVEEAGIGAVCAPNPGDIKRAVEGLISVSGGRDYVLSKWTPRHYADNLKHIICNLNH